ncbi:MAG: hypothetical protein GY820_48295 [Gammaproteobacteria bacterium]|nr:hypothetical protein [Gammaproteobacteria bacterium]
MTQEVKTMNKEQTEIPEIPTEDAAADALAMAVAAADAAKADYLKSSAYTKRGMK